MSTPYQNQPPNDTLTPTQKLNSYRQLCRIRQFDQVALCNYKDGVIGGWLPAAVGQEAVAVGTIPLLGEHDQLVTTFRHSHHTLTIGVPMNECMAELFGKAAGCSRGKGGALSFHAPERNHRGSYANPGTQAPIATGIAFALKYREIPGCCLCFLGDGEVNAGAVHESFNLAALYQLPVVFIIENNGLTWTKSNREASAFNKCLAERAKGYGIAWDKFDDQNLYEIRSKTQIAINRARESNAPTVLEINTYRYYGLNISDAANQLYRTYEAIQERRENHDPLKLWAAQLIKENLATEVELKEFPIEAREEAKAAVEFAKQSRFPTIEESMQDIYSESTATGRHFFND